MKHQLFVEISKHKQTQKNLQEALEKVKELEHLIGNKTRKQLLIDKKNAIFVTQSLTNLRNVRYNKFCLKDNFFYLFSRSYHLISVIFNNFSTAISTTNKYKKYNNGQNDNLVNLDEHINFCFFNLKYSSCLIIITLTFSLHLLHLN